MEKIQNQRSFKNDLEANRSFQAMTTIPLQRRLGGAVTAHRHNLCISQEKLAARAGLHRTYIADIERGARNPSLSTIEKLAAALDVPMTRLFADSNEGSLSASETGPVTTAGEVVEILMAEDNPIDVALTLRVFNRFRIANRICVVHDGAAALEFVFGSDGWTQLGTPDRPRLILLDLKLPKVPGLEVLRRLKAHARTRSIPVVVLTASRNASDNAECRRLGADNYLIKPVSFQRLSTAIAPLAFQWALLRHPQKAIQ